jgi:hypothetical protein
MLPRNKIPINLVLGKAITETVQLPAEELASAYRRRVERRVSIQIPV